MTTFERLSALHPDRVGHSGRWADNGEVEVHVVDTGAVTWSLYVGPSRGSRNFWNGGEATSPLEAWHTGCACADEYIAMVAEHFG